MIKKQKLPFDILDSIRGIAALYVAIAHCRGVLWMGGTEYSKLFPRAGWDVFDYLIVGSSLLTRMAVEFVIVFFVLSGFSIAHSLSSETSALSFYKRRLIRIYPSYIMALLWAGIVFFVTKAAFPEWYDGTFSEFAFIRTTEMNGFFEPVQIARNILYMPGNGLITPLWSLTYEVIFYLLAPFLLRRINLYLSLSAFLFVAYLLIPGEIDGLGIPIYFHRFLFEFNIYFAIGIFFYKYYSRIMAGFSRIPRMAAGSLLLILLASMYLLNFKFGGETWINFLVSGIFSVGLILYFILYQVRLPWLIKVGQFSYTLYITHFATIYLYLAGYWWLSGSREQYIVAYWVWMPAVIFCLLVAWLNYRIIESKTKDILDRLRKKQKATALKIGN